MAQAKEDEINRATQTQQRVSMQMSSNFSRDLLQRFISGNHFGHKYQQQQTSQDDDNEEIELSLGLSLNGRFGIDPTRDNNKLIRSSSIPDFLNPISRDNDSSTTARMIHMGGCSRTNLTRACSLPTETEEEWRKRKELQTLRRMEAKRKRSEKKAARERNRGFGEENGEEDVKREEVVNGNYQQDQCVKVANENLPFGGLNWVNGGARGGCGIEVRGEKSNGFVVVVGGGEILPPAGVIARAGSQGVIAGAGSQGSTGSQGSGSSGISEFESQPIQGMNKGIEARSPASVQSLPQSEQKSLVTPGSIVIEKSGNLSQVAVGDRPNKPTVTDRQAKEMVRNVLEDMPCVSTKGDGPNGKRIEGFLYRYRKGEEVRIVCVCHGSFLSPAEFVKHAGGGDVAHPLKHIVVSPSSPLQW